MAGKICYKCKVSKATDEFYRDCTKRDGLQARCKACAKIRNDEYRAANPDYFKMKGKERYYGIEDRKSYNKARYAANRENMIAWRARYGSTVRGRITSLVYGARTRAKSKSLDCDIDAEWLADLFDRQEMKCSLTGLDFDIVNFYRNGVRDRKFNPYSPSLDRIDSAKGYTKDNTRLVITAMNLALNSFGEEVFRKVAEGYLKNHQIH